MATHTVEKDGKVFTLKYKIQMGLAVLDCSANGKNHFYTQIKIHFKHSTPLR